jgi:quercetin dioxygenase-like cupin family protein
MAERSVAWDTGEAISGTPFRHMIKAAGTGSRFSAQLAVVKAGELIIPHSHRDEDEFSFVFRGRIGGRVATTTWWLRSGSIFKPRGIVPARWNPTDVCPARSAPELARCREGRSGTPRSGPQPSSRRGT